MTFVTLIAIALKLIANAFNKMLNKKTLFPSICALPFDKLNIQSLS